MEEIAANHFGDVGRAGDFDAEIFGVEFGDDFFDLLDELLRVAIRYEHDHVAGATVFGNEQAGPERTFFGVFEIFGAVGEAFDAMHVFEGVELLSEAIEAVEISRRGNIGRGYGEDQLAVAAEDAVDFSGFLGAGIVGREEETFVDVRFEVDKSGNEAEANHRDSNDEPVKPGGFLFWMVRLVAAAVFLLEHGRLVSAMSRTNASRVQTSKFRRLHAVLETL